MWKAKECSKVKVKIVDGGCSMAEARNARECGKIYWFFETDLEVNEC